MLPASQVTLLVPSTAIAARPPWTFEYATEIVEPNDSEISGPSGAVLAQRMVLKTRASPEAALRRPPPVSALFPVKVQSVSCHPRG